MRLITKVVVVVALVAALYAGLVYAMYSIRRAAAREVLAAGYGGWVEYTWEICDSEEKRHCVSVPPQLPGTVFVLDAIYP